VYDADGKLLYDDRWHSSYVGDAQLVRVGTKKAPKKKPAAHVRAATRLRELLRASNTMTTHWLGVMVDCVRSS